MKFSPRVEQPVWDTPSDTVLTGIRGVLGAGEVRYVAREQILSEVERLKSDPERPFPVLYDLTAIDESQRMVRLSDDSTELTVQYMLWSPPRNEFVTLKVPLSFSDPKCPSVYHLFKNADWYEREAFDMFGVQFDEHPNLTRILMPEWWEGYPLLKSYPGRATELPPLVVTQEDLKEYDKLDLVGSPESLAALAQEYGGEEPLILNLGPNHPGTHGVLRIVLKLDGEYMVGVEPLIGYHHRGAEKVAERQTFHTYIPYTDRVDYLAGTYNELPYVMACEQLAGVKVPERAQMIRVLLGEIFRICNHLVWLGTLGHDVGAMTPVFYTFREREKLFKVVELIAGGRMHPNYLRIGGVSMDLPEGWEIPLREFLKNFDASVDEYNDLLIQNPIFKQRTQGVGVMTQQQCWEWGITGSNLRATGIPYDLRKIAPYSGYEQFDFEIPIETGCDCFARAAIRLAEMRQSARIIEQCISKMPVGDYIAKKNRFSFPPRKEETMMDIDTLINHFLAVGWGLDMPPGESFVQVEQPKGIAGYYLVSDGRSSPYRMRIRTPSFANMQTLPVLCKGALLPDLLAVLGAMDYVLADIDR